VTHTRVPPPPLLSRDGSTVAVVSGRMLERASIADGARTSLELAHDAEVVALAADGARAFAGGAESLTLCGAAVLRTVPAGGSVLRVALAGGLAAALVRDGDRTLLRAWSGDALDPLVEGLALGELAPDGLLCDGARRRVLAWGVRGPDAALGEGELAVALVEIGADGPQLVWSGEGGAAGPNGFLFPLAGGAVGSYARDELVLLAPAAQGWERTARVSLADVESAAASPDGSRIAWSFSRYDEATGQDVGQIRLARLPAGTVERTLRAPAAGTFESLAVADDGTVSLAATRYPRELTVDVSTGGAFVRRLAVSL
jgi:hypothetical protein